MRAVPFLALFLAVLAAVPPTRSADERERLTVGVQPDGRIVVPTNQVLAPAGRQLTFPGRPVDLALAEDGRVLVAKCDRSLLFLDLATGRVRQAISLQGVGTPRPGFGVVGLLVRGNRVYASDAQGLVRVVERG